MTETARVPIINRREVWAVCVLLITGPITFVMYMLFAFGYSVYHALARWPKIQKAWRYGYGTPFSVLNLLYNLTIGSLMFLDRPRWLQFTRRLKEHKKKDHAVAFFMCQMVNVFDPGHC